MPGMVPNRLSLVTQFQKVKNVIVWPVCQLTLQQKGTLYPTNLWVQAQQTLLSVGPWQAEMDQYRNVSPRGTGPFMSVFHAYKLLHLGKKTLSKALTPSRNSMELGSIHLPQPLQELDPTGTGKRSDWEERHC